MVITNLTSWAAIFLPEEIAKAAQQRVLTRFAAIFYNFDAVPKGHMILDLSSRARRLCIVPGGIAIDLAFDFDVIIAGQTFPRAGGGMAAFAEILAVY